MNTKMCPNESKTIVGVMLACIIAASLLLTITPTTSATPTEIQLTNDTGVHARWLGLEGNHPPVPGKISVMGNLMPNYSTDVQITRLSFNLRRSYPPNDGTLYAGIWTVNSTTLLPTSPDPLYTSTSSVSVTSITYDNDHGYYNFTFSNAILQKTQQYVFAVYATGVTNWPVGNRICCVGDGAGTPHVQYYATGWMTYGWRINIISYGYSVGTSYSAFSNTAPECWLIN